MYNRWKKMSVIGCLMVGTLVSTFLVKTTVTSAEKEQSYVVVTKNDLKCQELKEEYQAKDVVKQDIEAQYKADDIVRVSLTKQEAKKLLESDDTIAVEKDITLSGSSETEQDFEKDLQSKDEVELNTAVLPEKQWNLDAVGAAHKEYQEGTQNIKVAVIDSGITYSSDLDVTKRINLVPDEENDNPLFEDVTGHGTSVASVIAAKDNEEGMTGINPNVSLYSVKVLDENNTSSLSRVIEGIYWCIEEEVDIINMSFGTSVDSEALHIAIQDAEKAGILMIAAAGNRGEMDGKSTVDYPAAYPEVMAVGSVSAKGEVSESSSCGKEIEIVAPGEEVPALGYFDNSISTNGTSMAAPHVAGVASILWAKDTTKSAEFIRNLINQTAKPMEDNEKSGNGYVDLQYAMVKYDEYSKLNCVDSKKSISNPTENIPYYSDDEVDASWSVKDHADVVNSAHDSVVISTAVKIPDIMREECELKSAYHGLGNYVKNYYYLMKAARMYYNGKRNEALECIDKTGSPAIKTGINNLENKSGWKKIFNYKTYKENNIKDSYQARGKVLIGFATHIAMDAYAHNAGEKSGDVVYEIEGTKERDNRNRVPERWNCAKAVGKEIVNNWFDNKETGVSLFIVSKHTKGTFYMRDLYHYVISVKSNIADASTDWLLARTATNNRTGKAKNCPKWSAWVQ